MDVVLDNDKFDYYNYLRSLGASPENALQNTINNQKENVYRLQRQTRETSEQIRQNNAREFTELKKETAAVEEEAAE